MPSRQGGVPSCRNCQHHETNLSHHYDAFDKLHTLKVVCAIYLSVAVITELGSGGGWSSPSVIALAQALLSPATCGWYRSRCPKLKLLDRITGLQKGTYTSYFACSNLASSVHKLLADMAPSCILVVRFLVAVSTSRKDNRNLVRSSVLGIGFSKPPAGSR